MNNTVHAKVKHPHIHTQYIIGHYTRLVRPVQLVRPAQPARYADRRRSLCRYLNETTSPATPATNADKETFTSVSPDSELATAGMAHSYRRHPERSGEVERRAGLG